MLRGSVVGRIRSPNLASKISSMVAKQLPQEWFDVYAYRPVLFETFVDSKLFTGGCYKAANWIYVGETKGRGKLDRHHTKTNLSVKSIWIYPLCKNFKEMLR